MRASRHRREILILISDSVFLPILNLQISAHNDETTMMTINHKPLFREVSHWTDHRVSQIIKELSLASKDSIVYRFLCRS